MKTVSSILISFVVLFFLTKCKKNNTQITQNPTDTIKPIDTSNKAHFTILLRDKPLDTIQKYISGSWQLHYEKGGVANGIFPQPDSIYLKFSYNRIKFIYKTQTGLDTTLTWLKGTCHLCQFGDSTFIYHYWDKNGYPYEEGIHGIFNDTLITYDSGSDPFFYYYTKIK